MKKLNYFLVLTLAVLSFGLVSCGGQVTKPDDPKNPDNKGSVRLNSAMYIGKSISHYTDHIRLEFLTGTLAVEADNMFKGKGELVFTDLVAEVDPTTKFPKAGTYKLGNAFKGTETDLTMLDNGSLVPCTIAGQMAFGTIVYDVDDAVSSSEPTVAWVATDATLTISGNAANATIDLKVKLENEKGETKDYTLNYKGAVSVDAKNALTGEEYFKGFEDPNKTTKNVTFAKMEGSNFGDQYKSGLDVYQFSMVNSSKETAWFTIYVDPAKGVNGTYNITHHFGANTADRTHGVMLNAQGQTSIAPPFFGVLAESGAFSAVWFIDGGTVTIADKKITFDVTTYYGSTIKGTYEGEVTFATGAAAPEAFPVMMK